MLRLFDHSWLLIKAIEQRHVRFNVINALCIPVRPKSGLGRDLLMHARSSELGRSEDGVGIKLRRFDTGILLGDKGGEDDDYYFERQALPPDVQETSLASARN